MDLTEDYEKLFNHWLEEFQNSELTKLTPELFDEYNKFVKQIKEYRDDTSDVIKEQLLKSYKDNIKYLFKDLLKLRKVKIINSALSLKEMDLDKMIEAEKLLFQNLVSSLKGYKKVKAISIYEEEENSKSPKLTNKELNEITEIPQTSQPISQEDIIKSETSDKNFKYTLIRILEKTPAIVGIDLINYGPFKKEDIAHLPAKNAKILIYEKFAEEIDIT